MPVRRNRLPNRRQVSTVSLMWPPNSGERYHITIGEYQNGAPGEIWVHGPKVGSEIYAILSDASVLLSVLIQVGYDAAKISNALGRVESGERASIIGAMADLLVAETAVKNG